MSNLMNTNVQNLEPNYIGWKLTSDDVEAYVTEYLEKQGIKGVLSSTLMVNKEGNSANVGVSFYVFFDMASDDIQRPKANIPAHMLKKVGKANFYPSQKLQKAITPLVPWSDNGPDINIRMHEEKKTKMLYIKCNIFKVLSSMLNAPTKHYQINIMKAENEKRGKAVLTVIKSVKEQKYNDGGNVFKAAASKLK